MVRVKFSGTDRGGVRVRVRVKVGVKVKVRG
jgi:hypothetical protein